MKHCMMNNVSENMDLNEQSVDNGSMWEAEPIVVLPPNTPHSMPMTTNQTVNQTGASRQTSHPANNAPAAAVAPIAASRSASSGNSTVSSMPPVQTLNVSTSPRASDPSYLQGYLQNHIGKYVQVYFVIGTQQNAERDGILNEIGSNFFVLREVGSNRLIVCDLYSVKFVNVYDLREEDLRLM